MSEDTERIGLADWISSLRAELQRAQQEGEGQELQFTVGPLELEFQMTATREADGKAGVKFWVVELGGGGKVSSGLTQRVRMTLSPTTASGNPVTVRDKLTGQSE
jgi:hypothetical protein